MSSLREFQRSGHFSNEVPSSSFSHSLFSSLSLSHSLFLSLLYSEIINLFLEGQYHCTADLLFDWFGCSRYQTSKFVVNSTCDSVAKTSQCYAKLVIAKIKLVNARLNLW